MDFETGGEVRATVESAVEFDRLVNVRYPHSVRVFSDASRDDSSGGLGVGFCAPFRGYRFGIRLASFTSILSAELYSIFCAPKYILRMRFPSTVVFTDSLYSLYHLRDGFFSTRTSPYVYKILHLLSFIQEQEFTVGFAWIPSHAGIVGNEQADYFARLASRLPFTVNCGIPLADLLSALRQDNRAWCRVFWPYAGTSPVRGDYYFNRISFETLRPWFTGHRFPRGYISLVTRLRTAHICTGSHFSRMGWDMDVGCGCGVELKSLAHLIGECLILSVGKPRFFRFLA